MLTRMSLFFFLIAGCLTAFAQTDSADDNGIHSRNSIDIQCFGNKGFLAVGYNRKLCTYGRFSLLAGPAVGIVPGEKDSGYYSPTYIHLNAGSTINFSFGLSELCAGASYSRILADGKGYDRVIGEFGYILHFRHDDLAIKIAYTPVWYDSGAADVQYIPVSATFRLML